MAHQSSGGESPPSDETLAEARDFVVRHMGEAKLGRQARAEIEQLLNVNECEMAFEGLFLELFRSRQRIGIDSRHCLSLARRLGFERHSVFEPDFWRLLNAYLGAA